MIVYLTVRIGINTRFLQSQKMEGFGWYTYEVVKRMVEAHPEHDFYFFFDRPFDAQFVFGKNVTPIVLFPPARHPLLFKIWFNFSITKALKKHQIDVFYSPDGYLSLKTKVPQVGVIHDINFEHHPEDIPKGALKYLRNYFPKFAKKAHHLMTVSDYSKQDIVKTYGINPSKITVAWNGASEKFMPLDIENIEQVRNKYSNGRPYFIYVGAIHPRKNINRLLQAFELFSKENSTIDLMIVGENMWSNPVFSNLSTSEKLKKRVVFTGHVSLDELTLLMGSAVALTYVSYFEGFGIPLVEAMRCGIPIISGNLTSLPEVVGDAAILVDPYKVEEIAKAMQTMSENPALIESLKEKSIQRAPLFSWNHTAESTWKVLEELF